MSNSRRNSRASAPPAVDKDRGEMLDRQLSGSLGDSLGFLISDSARYVKRSLYARISNHGIRGGAWFVLRALWLQDGVTQRELATRLGLMEPSVQEMLRAMERDGLVTRARDEEDRRKVRIRLTAHARELEPVLMEIADDVNKLMLSQLSSAEEVLLKLLLRKVRETLAADSDAFSLKLPQELS